MVGWQTMIGDYLGQHEEFQLSVMHAYVDSMKFENMKFDEAIREFLKGFRLPGEAQKIDRIMEKFAERWDRSFYLFMLFHVAKVNKATFQTFVPFLHYITI